MFLLKKSLIGVAAAAVLGALVFGRDVFSYAKTFGCSARDAIKSEVPIEFEIQRARDMVENLVPDIRNCMHLIAEEEVNVEHLSKDIASAENELQKQKDQILALRRDVDEGRQTYRYASRTYTSNEVKRDLASRFERFKTAEDTLQSKRAILEEREKAVAANRVKLDEMLQEKRKLEVQLENVDARLKTVQAAQTASNVQLDNSQLARAKKLIGELNKQLDVRQRMLDAEGKFTGLIPVESACSVPEDLSNQIDEYFGRGKKPIETDKTVAERSL
jgi:hypothetical protein